MLAIPTDSLMAWKVMTVDERILKYEIRTIHREITVRDKLRAARNFFQLTASSRPLQMLSRPLVSESLILN